MPGPVAPMLCHAVCCAGNGKVKVPQKRKRKAALDSDDEEEDEVEEVQVVKKQPSEYSQGAGKVHPCKSGQEASQ